MFVWVPAHTGIVGNDRSAKEAVQINVVELNICLARGEGKVMVKKEVTRIW